MQLSGSSVKLQDRGRQEDTDFVKKITNNLHLSLTLPAGLIRLTATIEPDVLKTVGVKPLFSAVLRSVFPIGETDGNDF